MIEKLFHFCKALTGDQPFGQVGFFALPDEKIAYLPIAKNANSAITKSMSEGESADGIKVFPRFDLDKLPEDYYSFSYVRNPFDRLVSCYVDKVQRRDDYFVTGSSPYVFLNKDKGFEHFVRMITLIPDRLMDKHFAPQYLYLFDRKGTSRVKLILKLEDIAETYPAIQRKYGFRELEIINKTERKNWETFYSLKTAKAVYKKYRKDFKMLGYDDEYKKLVEYIINRNRSDSK